MHCLMLLHSRRWLCALSGSVRGRISELMLSKGASLCDMHACFYELPVLRLICAKPQIESRAETTRATHDTFMDMLFGPMTTDHRPIILTRCMTANIAKSNAETDPHRKAHQGVEMAIRIARGL